jgi:Stage II sporulation protein E (SpoIIE)
MTGSPPRLPQPGRWPIAVESAVVAVCAYLVAGVAELGIIRSFQPTELELTWISDALLATALGGAVYLWRHLSATRRELAVQERRRLVLDTQLAIAAEMQRRLLPKMPPPDHGVQWAADLRPAGSIGGDFYDIVPLGPGRAMALAADVSGKGVPAAMALSTVRAAFRSIVSECHEPAWVLTQLSAVLYDQWGGDPYLTALVIAVDAVAGRVTYANAGHPAGIVAGWDGLRLLPALGPPAALLPGIEYQAGAVALRPGDVGVLVSDGVTEGLGDTGASSLQQLVSRIAAAGPSAHAACTLVMNAARLGRGPTGVLDWQDDLTVVVFALAAQEGTATARALEVRYRTSTGTGASASTAPAALSMAKPTCSSIQPEPMLASAPPPQTSASPKPCTRTRSAAGMLSVRSALPPTNPRFQPTPSNSKAASSRP